MTDAPVDNLSRAKIHRLLTAVGSACDQAEAPPQVAAYDWRDPHYFDEEQRNRLAAAMSRIAAVLSEKFVHFYGAESNVAPTSITQRFAGGLADAVDPDGSFCLAFGADPKQPCGFFAVDAGTALNWVTLLLGDVEAQNDPDRVLSALEESLLSDVVVALTEAFLGSLRSGLELQHVAAVTKGCSAVSYESTEEICVIVFAVKRADANQTSSMRFVLPCRTLAPLVGKPPAAAAQPAQESLQRVMMEHLQQMPVTVTARFCSAWLSFEEVLDLGQGDIVLIDKPLDEPIELMIDNQTVFQGRPAQSGGRYAVVITEGVSKAAVRTTKAAAR